jgi:hypothetical protein
MCSPGTRNTTDVPRARQRAVAGSAAGAPSRVTIRPKRPALVPVPVPVPVWLTERRPVAQTAERVACATAGDARGYRAV